MTTELQSYLCDSFVHGQGEGTTLFNPTTEAAVATTSTRGLDMGGALAFARERGGPALRAMSFAERGALLSAMAKSIHAHREALVALAIENGGNTRGDAKFDIDGCTGTLAYYGKVGRSLGDARFFVEEGAEQLAANPRYVGRHIRVPREGVAVHINAYNFPGWGFGEKAATALLAGMPVLTKPATSTSVVTERMVRILVEDEVLPPGVLSLVCGGAGDLVDHLQTQDVLAFTGSSQVGCWMRSKEELAAQGVRVNVEADSLNSAVLGPDLDRDSEAYGLFLREVARDITQKAGQKCTAIRRIFVPRESLEACKEDLIEEIKRVKVGDPSLSEVRMGPLATRSQLEDVQTGIQELQKNACFVLGDGGRGELVGVSDGRGYFVAPTLLQAEGVEEAGTVHDLEVFGPVQTLIPYSGDPVEACAGVAQGKGGLVSSVYTDDKAFATAMTLGLAAHHGRICLGHSKVAEHSPGPGTVLPQMIHGGPGRAGGGEELGGLRGLNFYMQRTAVQGLKPLIGKIVGSAWELGPST